MRLITQLGWQVIGKGFQPYDPPLGVPIHFWEWASEQGDAFQMAAHFILKTADAGADDFRGEALTAWIRVGKETSPMRLARCLDAKRRGLIIEFLSDPPSLVR